MVEYTEQQEAEEIWGGEDSPDQYICLAIDPGGTTGWAVMGVHPDAVTSGDASIQIHPNIEFWTAGQVVGDEDEQVDFLLSLIESWPSARLVIEDFILRKSSQGRELLAPVRITAALKWAIRPRYFNFQQPGLAMSTLTDDRQRAAGLWIPGQEHARDATKHCVTYLRRQRERHIRAAQEATRRGPARVDSSAPGSDRRA